MWRAKSKPVPNHSKQHRQAGSEDFGQMPAALAVGFHVYASLALKQFVTGTSACLKRCATSLG